MARKFILIKFIFIYKIIEKFLKHLFKLWIIKTFLYKNTKSLIDLVLKFKEMKIKFKMIMIKIFK
jgi:hypothetical protein